MPPRGSGEIILAVIIAAVWGIVALGTEISCV
jgi:hypothetical protein